LEKIEGALKEHNNITLSTRIAILGMQSNIELAVLDLKSILRRDQEACRSMSLINFIHWTRAR